MALIDILRQHNFPRSETTSRDRKISGCYTEGYACLMGEKLKSLHIGFSLDRAAVVCTILESISGWNPSLEMM